MDFLRFDSSWMLLSVLAVFAGTDPTTVDESPGAKLHDSKSMFVEMEAAKMMHQDDEYLKKKLASYLDRIDTNKDSNIDKNELAAWLAESYQETDQHAVLTYFSHHDKDDNHKLTWSEVLEFTSGYSEDELARRVAENDEAAINVHKLLHLEQAKFRAADTNQDGALSNTEFYHYALPRTSKEISEVEINKTIAELDKDGDGRLDLDEFMGDAASHAENQGERRAAEAVNFQEYDINKNGFLDHEEIREWQVPSYETSAKSEVEHLFAVMDYDKNGLLSREEMLTHSTMFSGTHIMRDHDEL